MEMPEGRLLIYNNGAQYAHYRTNDGRYTRRGQRLFPPCRGIPVVAIINPFNIEMIEDLQNNNTPEVRNDLDFDLRWAKISVGHISSSSDRKFATSWKEGVNLLIGTDGGLKNNIGTVGVRMTTEEEQPQTITAMSAETCVHQLLHSTREELRAQLSAELLLDKFGSLWGRDIQRTVTMVCDSKSALHELSAKDEGWRDRNPLGQEMDVLMTIDRLRDENANIRRIYIWEKSHQKKEDQMTKTRRINEEADLAATPCRQHCEEGLMIAHPKVFLPDSICTFKLNGGLVTKNLKEAVHRAFHDEALKKIYVTSLHGRKIPSTK